MCTAICITATTDLHTFIYTHPHTHIHTHTHTITHTHTHTHKHTHTHTHTRTHTHSRTCTHTHTHTHEIIRMNESQTDIDDIHMRTQVFLTHDWEDEFLEATLSRSHSYE